MVIYPFIQDTKFKDPHIFDKQTMDQIQNFLDIAFINPSCRPELKEAPPLHISTKTIITYAFVISPLESKNIPICL